MKSKTSQYVLALRKLYFWKVTRKYFGYGHTVQPDNYLLICTMPCDTSNNVLHVAVEMANSGLSGNATVALLGGYDENAISMLKDGNIEFVFGYDKVLAKKLSSAEWIILDSHFSMFFEKAAGQKVAQLWHAAGAFKRFGLHVPPKQYGQRFERWIRKEGLQYDFLAVSNTQVIDIYRDALSAYNASIVPVGLPRSDYILNVVKNQAKRERSKKVILYAPTFRNDEKKNPLDIEKLTRMLSDEYELWIRLHPAARGTPIAESVRKAVNEGKFIRDVSQMDYMKVLKDSDILITDYSSIIFDYAIFGRPMLFFAYDLEEYKIERGFYEEYSKYVPGPICRSVSELVDCVQKAASEKAALSRRAREFAYKNISPLDGKASKRVVAIIKGMTND